MPRRQVLTFLGGCACVLIAQPAGAASYKVHAAAVNEYDSYSNFGDLHNAIANAWGFYYALVYQGTDYSAGYWWLDEQVVDSHFLDPEKYPGGADYVAFDSYGSVFSYFAGHGWGGTAIPASYTCNSAADCPAPPGGATGPATCRQAPPNMAENHRCKYNVDHAVCTASPYDISAHRAYYSDIHADAAFGESNYCYRAGSAMGIRAA